ncbi:MAG: penicillin-binding protein 1C [Psychroflexus sp.]|nr:penicillin-binding protein 1C [Psychroflexus sp.]
MMQWLKQHKVKLGVLLIIFLMWWFSLPDQLFDNPYSTTVYAKDKQLIGAKIAADEQWRFPGIDKIPKKFKACILHFEDEYFYKHPGFNPVAISKALVHNLSSETRIGASTITQQVIRLSRKNKKRTYVEKFIELVKATRLEAKYSKEKILQLYVSNAPFGGNVVGLSAASWRYFGVSPDELSWGQAAALAVLPNAPSIIYPGRNSFDYKKKRDQLLQKLLENQVIDSSTYELAVLEKLPGKPKDLPQDAYHLTHQLKQKYPDKNRMLTTIDYALQSRVNQQVDHHFQEWKQNKIYNAAVLVLDIETKEVLAYVGNTKSHRQHQPFVDLVQANRSTGSLLKPILYASMLDHGELMPQQLIADIPTNFDDYQPENFDKDYDGAVQADVFLQKSLNVPAVRLLKDFGLQRFYNLLVQMNLEGLDNPADHYGLPLILGGAESSLWDLTKTYANMASSLKHYNRFLNYRSNDFNEPELLLDQKQTKTETSTNSTIGAGAIYSTLMALKDLKRPGIEAFWQSFADKQKIAWKTGTSYGFKDAWAIGVNAKYAVGVWTGNANGTGRPHLVGVKVAAPLMFKVFDVLPQNDKWFKKPHQDFKKVNICDRSGWIAGLNCPEYSRRSIPKRDIQISACPYHKIVNLTKDEAYQVKASCPESKEMLTKAWFNLPPIMEYFYKKKHPDYQPLPDFLPACQSSNDNQLAIYYPKEGQKVILPKTFEQENGKLVFKATSAKETKLYWYLNERFLKTTKDFHELARHLKPDDYQLSIMDENGNQLSRQFRVVRQ